MTRDVAILSFAQTSGGDRDETEMLFDVIGEALAAANLTRKDIGFTVSGSCDFLVGRPFSFVMALDAAGAWPPISESHVEMDGAFALHEAWVHLLLGEVDAALIYSFARASLGPLNDLLALQLDPYLVTPLWPDAAAIAGLQARALVDAGRWADARVAPPRAIDGAAAMVIAAGDKARAAPRRAWIRGLDHRIEPQALGGRDLTRSVSTELAARHAGVFSGGTVDAAALHTPFAHEEVVLRAALRLEDTPRLPAPEAPPMVAGLASIGAAARAVMEGGARRALGHATSGPCLQQNLVCLVEGAPQP